MKRKFPENYDFPKEIKSDEKAKKDEEPKFLKRDGLKWVFPYFYCFQCYAKGRWIGKTVEEVFVNEFFYEKEFLHNIIKEGYFRIFDSFTTPNHVLHDNDLINTIVHRHEFPVPDVEINVIYEDSDLLVINKPSGYPVHPSGRFRHNSIIFTLTREHHYENIRCVHRLDRFTSGILIFAKSQSYCNFVSRLISSREVRKVYLCKVEGDFPEYSDCEMPIKSSGLKFGLSVVHESGKPASTSFKKIHFDGTHSYVACLPVTGRMHQIRVHLQYLGYPIVGDNVYGHKTAFGPSRGKGGVTEPIETIIKAITGRDSEDLHKGCDDPISELYPISDCGIPFPPEFEDEIVECCPDCQKKKKIGNPLNHMYLHAYRYKFDKFDFKTDIPSWITSNVDSAASIIDTIINLP